MEYDAVPNQYGQLETRAIGTISYRAMLVERSTKLKQQAADIDLVIASFDANPAFEQLLDAMRRLGI